MFDFSPGDSVTTTHDYQSDKGLLPKGALLTVVNVWGNKIVTMDIETYDTFDIHPFDNNGIFPLELQQRGK